LILFVMTVLVGVGAVLYNPSWASTVKSLIAAPPPAVVTFPVREATLTVTVNEKGTLQSAKNEDVQSEVEGTTTIIFILPEGSRVKKGDKVCELDSATLKDNHKNQMITSQQAAASYEQAKLTREVAEVAVKEYLEGVFKQDLETVQGEIALARADVTRAQDRLTWSTKMKEKGYISESARLADELSLKKAQFALEQSQTKLDVLMKYTKDKTVKELQADVEKAKSDELAKKATFSLEKDKEDKLLRQINNCILNAPGDGLVVYANDPGRGMGGGNQVQIEEGASVRERQKIFSLPDITQMRVDTKVHESMVERIRRGLKAHIRVDAFADQSLEGEVQTIAPMADQSTFFGSDIKVYTTQVKINNGPTGLRPGMSAMVEILVDQIPNCLAVPVQAVMELKGKNLLYVKRADGTFDRREVVLGTSNDQLIEVKKGLKTGEEIVMTPTLVMTAEDKSEFSNATKEATKKDWGPDAAKGNPPAETKAAGPGAAAKGAGGPGGPGAGAAAPGGPQGKGAGGPGGAQGKGTRKGAGGGGFGGGGGGMPSFFSKLQNLSAEERASMRTASDEERTALMKKAGLTDEELDQMKQMRANRPPGGGGGGGFGGPGGGGGGRPGGAGGGPPQ
jgi:RND family efflux transporter MFP subunit